MTFDKFLKRNKLIADHLARIATRRDSVGWVDSAMPLDAAFREVLAAQERLLTATERLLDSCDRTAVDASNEVLSAESPSVFDEAPDMAASSHPLSALSIARASMATAH